MYMVEREREREREREQTTEGNVAVSSSEDITLTGV